MSNLQALDGVDGGLEVLLGLAGEADDDVGGDGEAGAGGFHFLADLDELLVFVRPAHFPQDAVGAALHREMDVRAEFRQIGEGGDEVVAVADGMRRGEADALDAIDFMHGFEQLHEGRLAVDFRKLGAAVEIDDLA